MTFSLQQPLGSFFSSLVFPALDKRLLTKLFLLLVTSYTLSLLEAYAKPATLLDRWSTEGSHNTGNFTPYSFRRYCEPGSKVHGPYLKGLESLTICGYYCWGNTFSLVILKPWCLDGPAGVELSTSRMVGRGQTSCACVNEPANLAVRL